MRRTAFHTSTFAPLRLRPRPPLLHAAPLHPARSLPRVHPTRRAVMSTPSPTPAGTSADTLFAIRLLDKPDSGALRAATRSAHLAWARSPSTRMLFAGPLRNHPTDDSPLGSLLILQASPTALPALLASDPYASAGLFASTDARAWVRGMATSDILPDNLYMVWCVDRTDEDALMLRKETRPKHLQWWRDSGRAGMIGPFPAPAGVSGAVGSLIVCSGESVQEVSEWSESDPYKLAGLFETVHVCAVTKVIEGDWQTALKKS